MLLIATNYIKMLSAIRARSTKPASFASAAAAVRQFSAQAAARSAKSSHQPAPAPSKQEKFVTSHDQYQVATYSRPNIVMAKGTGSYLWDAQGKQYIDLMAGIAVTGLGHSHPAISRILHDQASTLIHASNLYHNEFTPVLCKNLVDATKSSGVFDDATSAFICNSGTEANEAALKFARKYGKVVGGSNDSTKTNIVNFTGAFHGRSFGALSVTPNPKYQAPFSPMVPNVKTGTFNDTSNLETLIDEDTAGVIVEPIQGEGGVNPATPEFLAALRKRCDEVGAALIFDEIQCGLGRTGTLWAHQNYNVKPDILSVAKALGNGFPIGAVIVNQKIHDAIKVGDHGTTYGGNPLGAAVALEVFSQLSSHKLLTGVGKRAKILEKALDDLVEDFPGLVKERRGAGLIQGLEIDIPVHHVTSRAMDQGVLIINAGPTTLRFLPALNIPLNLLKSSLKTLRTIIKDINYDREGGGRA